MEAGARHRGCVGQEQGQGCPCRLALEGLSATAGLRSPGRVTTGGGGEPGLPGLPDTAGCSQDGPWQELGLSAYVPRQLPVGQVSSSSPRWPSRLAGQAAGPPCACWTRGTGAFLLPDPLFSTWKGAALFPRQPPRKTPDLPAHSHRHALPALLPDHGQLFAKQSPVCTWPLPRAAGRAPGATSSPSRHAGAALTQLEWGQGPRRAAQPGHGDEQEGRVRAVLPAPLRMPAASAGELGHVCNEGLRPTGRDAELAGWEAPGTADSSRESPGLAKESPSLPAAGWCFPCRPKGHGTQTELRSVRTEPREGGSTEPALGSQLKQLCNPQRQAEAQDLTFLAKRPQSAPPEITHHYLRISSCTTGLQPPQGPSLGSRLQLHQGFRNKTTNSQDTFSCVNKDLDLPATAATPGSGACQRLWTSPKPLPRGSKEKREPHGMALPVHLHGRDQAHQKE